MFSRSKLQLIVITNAIHSFRLVVPLTFTLFVLLLKSGLSQFGTSVVYGC